MSMHSGKPGVQFGLCAHRCVVPSAVTVQHLGGLTDSKVLKGVLCS